MTQNEYTKNVKIYTFCLRNPDELAHLSVHVLQKNSESTFLNDQFVRFKESIKRNQALMEKGID